MSISSKLNEAIAQSFISLVNQKTGLIVRQQDRDIFKQKIVARMQSLKLISPDEYYLLLSTNNTNSQTEWLRLSSLLTNNESYFFRDKEQFNLLRKTILPELIERKRYNRKIRIGSLGCSTGQEAYSLAILLQEMIPNLKSWDILILGTDIDTLALKEAAKAVYAPWSFRGTEARIKQEYFQSIKGQYHLNAKIKNMVKFQRINLVSDPFPTFGSALKDMDLIICRNVFIYFDADSIKKVVNKIYKSLQPLGYFISGHTELSEQKLSDFKTLVFPESIIYQRPEKEEERGQLIHANKTRSTTLDRLEINSKNSNSYSTEFKRELNAPERNEIYRLKIEAKKISTPSEIKSPKLQLTETKSRSTEEILNQGKALFNEEKYTLAIAKFQELLALDDRNPIAYNLLAQIYANLSQYPLAIEYCQKALNIDTFNLDAYKLLAKIAEERGNLTETKRILKQILYLKPSSISAYLDLSFIYQQEGDLIKMNKMKQSAFNLLKQLPPNQKIEELDNLTATKIISLYKLGN